MILRRLTQHIKDQNWFAVGLDLAIVIVGVFLGFQVSAWNEDRADRATIALQLAEVRDDLEADLAALEVVLDNSMWRYAAAEYLLVEIGGEDSLADVVLAFESPVDLSRLPEISPDDHPTLLARVNIIYSAAGQRTGYESLVNAGNLRLISDRDLRVAIQRYYAGYETLQHVGSSFRDIRTAGVTILYRHGFSSFSEQDLDSVLEAARGDQELVAYIGAAREQSLALTINALERERQARALLARIEAELAQ